MYCGETREHECSPNGVADKWGCHSNVQSGAWVILCYDCLGNGCPTCSGSGAVKFPKCPNRAVNDAFAEIGQFFRLFRWMDEKSIFPIIGGLMDQTAYFVHCCEFFNTYANAFRKRKAKAEKFMVGLKKTRNKNG